MARKRKTRPNNKSNQSEVGSYTVSMVRGTILCDTCCMPSATVYEFEDGSTVCDTCVHGMSTTDYFLTGILMTGGMYGDAMEDF